MIGTRPSCVPARQPPELNNYIKSARLPEKPRPSWKSDTGGHAVHSGHLGLTGISYGEIDNDDSCVSVEVSEMTNCKTSYLLQLLLSVNPTSDRKNICEKAYTFSENSGPRDSNIIYTKNTVRVIPENSYIP